MSEYPEMEMNDEQLYKELGKLADEVTQKNDEIDALKAKIKNYQTEISDLNEQLIQIKKTSESISNSNEQLISYQTTISRLTISNDKLKNEIELNQKQTKLAQKGMIDEIDNLKAKKIELEETIGNLKIFETENKKLKEKIKKMNIKEKDYQIETLTKEKDSLKKQIDFLNENQRKQNEEMKNLINENHLQKDKIIELNSKLLKAEKAIKDEKKENIRLQTELSKIKSSNDEIEFADEEEEENKKVSLGNLLDEEEDNPNKGIDELNSKIIEMQNENFELKQKLNEILTEKNSLYMEKEEYKDKFQNLELSNQRTNFENEKKIQKLENEILMLKSSNNENVSEGNNEQNDIVQKLKSQIQKQKTLIESLQKKIKDDSDSDDFLSDEEEKPKKENNNNGNTNNVNNEEVDRLNIANRILEEDLKENKNLSKYEHELISSSFYELALEIIKMKREYSKINKKNLTWLEIERMKNFP
ncbi:MAG: hypothetical protein MJ252_15295 [archaeon]|nr:hypothetical protein [archaeon]